jgi:hypothetical protein
LFNKFKYLVLFLQVLVTSALSAQTFCDKINDIQSYQNKIKTICVDGKTTIDTSTFNIDIYIKKFDKLYFNQYMKYDVYYYSDGFGARPYLIATQRNQTLDSIANISFKKSKKSYWQEKLLIHNFISDSCSRARYYIIPENSVDGYLQYIFFSTMGEQFSLSWHAKYNEALIICSENKISEIISDLTRNKLFIANVYSLNNLKGIQTEPIVEKQDNQYKITWIEYWTHSGIYRCTYSIETNPPYRITKLESEMLVEIETAFFY